MPLPKQNHKEDSQSSKYKHNLSDQDYLDIFQKARHGSDKPVGILRGIKACIDAYKSSVELKIN
jgi:hypothetical protein